jgi:hypothetical protein
MDKFIAGEDLQVGDPVSIDSRGRMVKARPGMPFLGALPPGTTVKDGIVTIPLPKHTNRRD